MSFLSKFLELKEKGTQKEKVKKPLEVTSLKDYLGTEEGYFDSLLTEKNFEGYTIERKVHVNRFDPSAHPACYLISYLFSKDSVPVLAVFVMKTNQWRAMIARGSYEVLEKNQIPYIRFFKEYDNKKDYVLKRVQAALTERK